MKQSTGSGFSCRVFGSSRTFGSNSSLRSDIMNVLPAPHRAYNPTQIGGSARSSIATSACARGCGRRTTVCSGCATGQG
eukprot:scaffold124044_cov69-Phaeocystis_antarctica.AAC.2